MLDNENLTWEYDNTSDCDYDDPPETDGDYGVNGLTNLTNSFTSDLSNDNFVEVVFNNLYWLMREFLDWFGPWEKKITIKEVSFAHLFLRPSY
jgi:hypothetical protein